MSAQNLHHGLQAVYRLLQHSNIHDALYSSSQRIEMLCRCAASAMTHELPAVVALGAQIAAVLAQHSAGISFFVCDFPFVFDSRLLQDDVSCFRAER